MMNNIRVACAIININEKILVVQRSESMSLPLKWEFPGGKIEENESEEDCILREIKEELNINIQVSYKLTNSIYQYPNLVIELIPFVAVHQSGNIKLTEHKAYLLLGKSKLLTLDWAEADLPIVKEYINYE